MSAHEAFRRIRQHHGEAPYIPPWCLCCGLPEHEPPAPHGAPEGFWWWTTEGTQLEWSDLVYLDDDELDREIVASRLGGGDFSRWQMAEVLGSSPLSIWSQVARGNLPEPHHRVEVKGRRSTHMEGRWTADQVAGAVLAKAVR